MILSNHINERLTLMTDCKFFNNGLVYNINPSNFIMRPCCYFKQENEVVPEQPSLGQYQKFKTQWIKSDLADNCSICYRQEHSGQISYRQAANDIIKKTTDKLVMLTISVNKKCNLACPTCDSSASSFWYQENIRNSVAQSENIIRLHKEDKEHIIVEKFLEFFKLQ